MSLAVFTAKVVDILTKQPDATEVVVKQCEACEDFDQALEAVNSVFDPH